MDGEVADSFGLRMKEVIRMVGSAERLARLAGMSARAIGQYAAGTSDPTRGKIIALATAAGVNVFWLMTGEGPKESEPAAAGREDSQPAANPLPQAEGLPQAVCETLRLIQELGTHQVELELQNEELRQAREERESLLERFTELYECAPVGYVTLDSHGVIRRVNLAAAMLLGMQCCRLTDRSFLPFIAVADRSSFTSFLGRVFAGKGKEVLELSLMPQGGKPPVSMQLQASVGSSVQECHVAVIPVTRREQVEELQSTIVDLQAFTYSVAHELRMPLRSINSLASVLIEDFGGDLHEGAKNGVNGIIKKTMSMSRLIDSLLVFSRNSKRELNPRPVDMNSLANELVRTLSEELNADVEFRVGDLPNSRGDWRMLGQALENLLSNAAKFSQTVLKPCIEVGAIEDEKENIYYVKDNGVGFDMKHAGTIFDIFTRLHKTEDFEGTGVGLAIVEQIIKKHDGKVWAESRQGQGSTFFFSLQKQ